MTRTRVLIVGTPLGARDAMNGSALGIRELAEALADRDEVTPIVLAERGADVPEGVERCVVDRSRIDSFFGSIGRTHADVVHAIFAPRRRTALGLRAIGATLRAPVVQTIASAPRAWSRSLFVGDRVVATSAWARRAIVDVGVPSERVVEIAMPFDAPKLVSPALDDSTTVARLLFVGDLEHGNSIEPTISAFRGVSGDAELVVAARDKSPAAVAIKAQLIARIASDAKLEGRVRWIGEVPSLLPWIAAARAVLLPASSTYAKLDHPRVLLEAIALGTPIVVGSAPSLAELVASPSIGVVAPDERALRDAMEAAIFAPLRGRPADAKSLAARAPSAIAAQYARLYELTRRA